MNAKFRWHYISVWSIGIKQSTPNFMVYGETGTYPISIDIHCRMISFWAKVIFSNALKLSMTMYNIVYSNYNFSNRRHTCFKWMDNIKILSISVVLVQFGTHILSQL